MKYNKNENEIQYKQKWNTVQLIYNTYEIQYNWNTIEMKYNTNYIQYKLYKVKFNPIQVQYKHKKEG